MAINLSQKAVAAIEAAVESLFYRVKARYLGPGSVDKRKNKDIAIGYRADLTLAALYAAAAGEEHSKPDARSATTLIDLANGYLDTSLQATKVRVVRAVDAFLKDAEVKGVKTSVATVLGGELADIWGTTTSEITKILDTEATRARNLGAFEGIAKNAAAAGIADPVVYFVIVRDGETCEECKRVHLMPDRVTPRVWQMSEASHKFHVRGEDSPSWCGLHPHCRCQPAFLMPGYGFDAAGMVQFVGIGHDELAKQRN